MGEEDYIYPIWSSWSIGACSSGESTTGVGVILRAATWWLTKAPQSPVIATTPSLSSLSIAACR